MNISTRLHMIHFLESNTFATPPQAIITTWSRLTVALTSWSLAVLNRPWADSELTSSSHCAVASSCGRFRDWSWEQIWQYFKNKMWISAVRSNSSHYTPNASWDQLFTSCQLWYTVFVEWFVIFTLKRVLYNCIHLPRRVAFLHITRHALTKRTISLVEIYHLRYQMT